MSERKIFNLDEKAVVANYEKFKTLDPFPSVEPSLLNSADIHDYILATGMISPYDPEYLKPATYGIRLKGEYIYWESKDVCKEGKFEDLTEKDAQGDIVFTLKSNTIVYVSLEPHFRLPDYIAARFNLKISHIHKGLLLGTGPIVDPGFDGKLCIPLHNLTNNDYQIKVSKTFIWMEFTKLSSNARWRNTTAETQSGQYQPYKAELKKDRGIRDYIHNAYPNTPIYSSVAHFIEETKSVIDDTKGINRLFQWSVIISIGGAFLSALSVIVATVMMHWKVFDYVNANEKKNLEINSTIQNYQSDIEKLDTKVDSLTSTISKLIKK